MFRKFLLLIIGVAALAVTAVEQRIATVNVDRVFHEYYKSRVAEEALQRQKELFRQHAAAMQEELVKLNKDAKIAEINSMNYALSEEERQKKNEELESLRSLIRGKTAELELFVKERNADMLALGQKKRNEIVAEIREEVRRRALAEGFAYVLDVSGQTTNMLPTVLVYPQENDITDQVIRELNRTAVKSPQNDEKKPEQSAK